MKTWPEWHKLWEVLLIETEAPCPCFTKSKNRQDAAKAIEVAEAKYRPAVDRACRHWMRKSSWPRMTAKVRWLVYLRIVNAHGAALLLLHPHIGSQNLSVPQRSAAGEGGKK